MANPLWHQSARGSHRRIPMGATGDEYQTGTDAHCFLSHRSGNSHKRRVLLPTGGEAFRRYSLTLGNTHGCTRRPKSDFPEGSATRVAASHRMKTVILAGGLGSRLSEETVLRPKPMVEVGGRPILWHIMNIYAAHGVDEFIIALGYKAEVIKEYFLNFYAINNDISIDLGTGETVIHEGNQPKWKIHLVDTGLHTQTGGRIRRLRRWLKPDETFMCTYGDGVADIDIRTLLGFHLKHGKLATVTTV